MERERVRERERVVNQLLAVFLVGIFQILWAAHVNLVSNLSKYRRRNVLYWKRGHRCTDHHITYRRCGVLTPISASEAQTACLMKSAQSGLTLKVTWPRSSA